MSDGMEIFFAITFYGCVGVSAWWMCSKLLNDSGRDLSFPRNVIIFGWEFLLVSYLIYYYYGG